MRTQEHNYNDIRMRTMSGILAISLFLSETRVALEERVDCKHSY